MPDLSKEQRLQVIEELVLATDRDPHRHEDGFKQDFCELVRAVVKDQILSASLKQRLYGGLRKTPAWPLVKQFLKYEGGICANIKCGHREDDHKGPNGACTATIYDWQRRNAQGQYPKCDCKGPYVERDFPKR